MTNDRVRWQVVASKFFLVLFIAVVAGFYAFQFWAVPLSNDAGTWGQFGDYFGGVLNPIVAFAAFYWLTKSIELQDRELRAARGNLNEALRLQLDQALTARTAADTQTENIRLASVANEIAHLRAQQREYLTVLRTQGGEVVCYDEEQMPATVAQRLKILLEAIRCLMDEEQAILELIHAYQRDLKTKLTG